MAKRFGVNVTRTITLEHTVYVTASSVANAMEKAREHFDARKGGDPYVTYKNAKGFAREAEGGEITEVVEIDDAWLEEDAAPTTPLLDQTH